MSLRFFSMRCAYGNPLIIIIIIMLAIPSAALSQQHISIFLSGNILFPSDENFKLVYKEANTVILPEAKLSVNLGKGMSIWVGFGFFSANGQTPILFDPAHSSQKFISSGIGYRIGLAGRLGMSFRAGLLYALAEESAMGETVSTSGIGFVVSGGPYFDISKNFGIELEAGYSGASTTVEDVAVKIGGFKAGLGLSISF